MLRSPAAVVKRAHVGIIVEVNCSRTAGCYQSSLEAGLGKCEYLGLLRDVQFPQEVRQAAMKRVVFDDRVALIVLAFELHVSYEYPVARPKGREAYHDMTTPPPWFAS